MNSIKNYPLILCTILLLGSIHIQAQNKYRVYFTDKNGADYNPYEYLDCKAIERRFIHHLPLCDSSDYPINENYLTQVQLLADSIYGTSRWMNAVFVYASNDGISDISKLPFVREIENVTQPISALSSASSELSNNATSSYDTSLSSDQLKLIEAQVLRLGGDKLAAAGLDGKGVRIAILDVGFKAYMSNPAFFEIRKRNGIVATRDFVKGKSNVETGMLHGTQVFSCVGGSVNNHKFGLATGADYLLARTESYGEFFNEEENWLMAAEWADKNGADIINSSLGYTFQRYLPEQMNGKTAFVSRAAQLAVDKGILVVLSAGNEGESSWKRVTAPGDAAGALTVGGIDPSTGIHIGFSSYGPSWDKRLKPEVTAYGRALVASKNGFATAEGTSFSSPLVAGFAACLKQKYPDITNTKLKEIICQSGDLWPYYDYAHGYGVPQPGFLKPDTTTSVEQFDIVEDSYSISIFPKDHLKDTTPTPSLSDTLTESARDSIAQLIVNSIFHKNNYMTAWPDVLFYHIKNKKGYLDRYYVLDLEDEENGSVTINKSIADRPFSIGIYYRGNYREIVVP